MYCCIESVENRKLSQTELSVNFVFLASNSFILKRFYQTFYEPSRKYSWGFCCLYTFYFLNLSDMKFDNDLQKSIFDYFNSREDCHFHGNTSVFFFRSWEKGYEKFQIDSKKPHGEKTNISFMVEIYSNRLPEHEKFGVNLSIEMYMWGYQTEETVFQGWVESLDELKVILKSVGL